MIFIRPWRFLESCCNNNNKIDSIARIAPCDWECFPSEIATRKKACRVGTEMVTTSLRLGSVCLVRGCAGALQEVHFRDRTSNFVSVNCACFNAKVSQWLFIKIVWLNLVGRNFIYKNVFIVFGTAILW